MIKIIVTAPRGKMDSLIVDEAYKCKEIQIVGGIGQKGREYIGEDIGLVAGAGKKIGALVYDDIEKIIDECDIVVDFSTVELSMEVLRACIEHKKAFICGTTGFTKKQENEIVEASTEIPVLKAANTSYMVNIMSKLLEIAAEALGDKCKIEIIDMHDENKKDAPSGTAKELAVVMSKSSNIQVSDMNFHSVRAGDISSSHTIIFGGMGERLELTHHAYNWRCYATGACEAIKFMEHKSAGIYYMEDVVKK